MKTTDFKELTSLYFEKEQDFEEFEDVRETREIAKEKLYNGAEDFATQNRIDCIVADIEGINQHQGFIKGFQYAMKLFLEAQGAVQTGVCSNE